MTDQIEFEDFKKVEMITAKITGVEEIEGADKLYKLTLDDGSRPDRQVVAGIKPWYDKDDLKDETVCLVANLGAKEIFGVQSEGMVLAVNHPDGAGGERATLIQPEQDVAPGKRLS